jgi:ABC-type Fe3+-hydroxamate transport system substrate-binding protein
MLEAPQSEPPLVDAAGTRHAPAGASPRIVSLVPSLTELICDLGLAGSLVGRTGFCVHPREVLRRIPKVGGTKDVNIERIRALAPTHLVVNIDENEKPAVDALSRFVPHIIVTHPLAPRDNLGLYRLLGGIFGAAGPAELLCQAFERALGALHAACDAMPRQGVLYLIWRNPWMTVSRDTYISRTLALVGWDTLPAAALRRYPEIELDEALLANADHILLSTEPYRFRERDVAQIQSMLTAAARARVRLIDGEMTSWYGSRAIRGLDYLRALRCAD